MRIIITTVLALGLTVSACGAVDSDADDSTTATSEATEGLAKATLAGGCFWCMEQPFDVLPGVVSTTSGYIAGHLENPTYAQVSAGRSGHTEAVEILFDPNKVTFSELLDIFWVNIDPVAVNRQFCDSGTQYRSGIYYHDEQQKQLAEGTKEKLEQSGRFDRPIATEIEAATVFYPAEEYHQDYYKKNPVRYKLYRNGCGRDRRLVQLWGDDAPSH
ncbi:MAG: peptide-methionine (S)-S-oxide reductase MsrA [Acidobacteriota bacterium]